MEREVAQGYSCTLKAGETVVYFSDHTTEYSAQQKEATVSDILSYHSKKVACCSVGTQTDDVIHRDTVTNTSTETDLNAVGDRKTLEALLRWALAICTSENIPILSDTEHFGGASFATACSNRSSSTIQTKASNSQLENDSNKETRSNSTWQEMGSNDSPNVIITDDNSLCSSELPVPGPGGGKLSLHATYSEDNDELLVPRSGCSELSPKATCSEDTNSGAPLEEVMEVDNIGGKNGTYLKLPGHDTATCSSERLVLSGVCMQSMSSQGMVQSSSANVCPTEDRERDDNQSQGGMSADSQQMSGVGRDRQSQGGATLVTQGRVAPIAQGLQRLRSAGPSLVSGSHFKCEKCDKQFDNEQAFDEHNWNHIQVSRIKTYTCPTCDKTFARNDNLKRHQLVHSDEKPFECSVCGKRFRRKGAVKRHSQLHVEKLHRCLQCDKTFAFNKGLQAHLQKSGHQTS